MTKVLVFSACLFLIIASIITKNLSAATGWVTVTALLIKDEVIDG